MPPTETPAPEPLGITLRLEPAGGNNTAFTIPDDVVTRLDSGRRPKVVVTAGGHTWRSSIVSMGGRFVLGVSRENRTKAGIAAGDDVALTLLLDTKPRTVEVPADLAAAVAAVAGAREAFDELSFTHQREHVESVLGAKRPETRERRIERVVAAVS
jgi:hypothetical protein